MGSTLQREDPYSQDGFQKTIEPYQNSPYLNSTNNSNWFTKRGDSRNSLQKYRTPQIEKVKMPLPLAPKPLESKLSQFMRTRNTEVNSDLGGGTVTLKRLPLINQQYQEDERTIIDKYLE